MYLIENPFSMMKFVLLIIDYEVFVEYSFVWRHYSSHCE
jgi:hypothetical protein